MAGCGRGKQGQSSRSQKHSCGADITWCWSDVGHAAAARHAAARERQPLSRAHPPFAGIGRGRTRPEATQRAHLARLCSGGGQRGLESSAAGG